MAVLAGETIIAGKVPGERIATTVRTASSASITTTETVVDTVVAPVVVGRIYRILWAINVGSSVASDSTFLRIREDNVSGTGLQIGRAQFISTVNYPYSIQAEYTADATEDKTFVATLIRATGTGNITAPASATQPAYLYVDYIRGP